MSKYDMKNLWVFWDSFGHGGDVKMSKTHILQGRNSTYALCGAYVPDHCDAGTDGGDGFCKKCERIAG